MNSEGRDQVNVSAFLPERMLIPTAGESLPERRSRQMVEDLIASAGINLRSQEREGDPSETQKCREQAKAELGRIISSGRMSHFSTRVETPPNRGETPGDPNGQGTQDPLYSVVQAAREAGSFDQFRDNLITAWEGRT